MTTPARTIEKSGAPQRPGTSPHLSWLHPLGLISLSVYNFVMRFLTLGIHHFWGKNEVRKRIWSSIRVEGEPLEYTGTGAELFRGFLVIFGIVFLPVMLATFSVAVFFGPDSGISKGFQGGLYLAFLLLTGVAIYRAQRYRLSRTRWRGIRASLVGSSLKYGWTYFWTMLLVPVTLGWISPWRATRLQRITTDDMRFGTTAFSFTASSRPLYGPFATFWLLMVAFLAALPFLVTAIVPWPDMFAASETGEFKPPRPEDMARIVVGVYFALFLLGVVYMILSAWYRAAMIRHFSRHTHIDGLSFASTVTPGGLMWITVSNFLLLVAGAVVATATLAAIGLFIWTLAGAGLGSAIGDSIPPEQIGGVLGVPMVLLFFLAMGMLLPVAQARSTGYLVSHLRLDGTLDTAAIEASAEQNIKRGEGLAQAFDIDAL
ncbi:MAG: DUF898 domain-containing protein [Hyphomicrobiaceae bacterium]|nr:DUF898 domain-containing protein [Hyphomicrobiaceae bacterium]